MKQPKKPLSRLAQQFVEWGKQALLASIERSQVKSPPYFFGQHTNTEANEIRKVKRLIGHRQYRKQRKALALAARNMK